MWCWFCLFFFFFYDSISCFWAGLRTRRWFQAQLLMPEFGPADWSFRSIKIVQIQKRIFKMFRASFQAKALTNNSRSIPCWWGSCWRVLNKYAGCNVSRMLWWHLLQGTPAVKVPASISTSITTSHSAYILGGQLLSFSKKCRCGHCAHRQKKV